ncbi:MAG TPA: exo-alpha-sialidase, partial [Verrucomicrobiae bacterium]
WLGNAQSDGKLITFYGTGEGLSSGTAAGGRPRGGFWIATSTDGKSWKQIANPPIGGGDPGAVKTRDGGLLVVITGESVRRVTPNRPGAAVQDGRSVPPLPAGEGRGEGERRARNFQPPTTEAPSSRDVIAYRVSSAGAVEKLTTFTGGGAPTVARLKDGRIIAAHQHFPQDGRVNHEQIGVRFSSDDGSTWTAPQVMQVAGLPDGMPFAFDPTLVPLLDGRVRIYFTGNLRRASGGGAPAIYSAISTDGVNYTFEPGVRFDVEGRIMIDCAAVLHQGVFHLFVPDNGIGVNPSQRPANEPAANRPREGIAYHATSKDGLNFTRVEDLQIEGRRRWLGNAQSDGKLITFYGTGEGLSTGTADRPGGAFWMATSEDGQKWKLVANPPIGGGDPGAVHTRDGGLLVVITGESRPRASGRPPYPANRDEAAPQPRSAGGADFPRASPRSIRRDGSAPVSAADILNQMWSQGQAIGSGPVRLKNFPLRPEETKTIVPMGMTASGHVTPSDHLYLVPSDSPDKTKRTDVLAVADGFLVVIQWRPKGNPDPTVFDREVDLKLTLEHSASCWSYYDHVTAMEESLLNQVGQQLKPGAPLNVRIPVKAGQVLGSIQQATFDFALIDAAKTRDGFARPEQFLQRDPWKLHTVDPFDYVEEPLRDKLLALNPRKAKPFGGQIGYDVQGRLAGNWYRADSGGYAGLNRRLDYWDGHLAFVPHHIEPTNLVVSLGNYEGRPRQFWVKGNRPDPAKVTAKDGLVKYELL